MVDGISVISAEELRNYTDCFVIITSKFHWKEIKEQLEKMGMSEKNYYCFGKLIGEITNPIYFDLPELRPGQNEVFVDAGGYNGETTEMFFQWAKDKCESAKSFIFEPDKESAYMCERLFDDYENVKIIRKGLWDYKYSLQFVSDGSESRIVATTETEHKTNEIPVVTLDNELQDEIVTFIKMDIEGAELRALKGAEKLIKKFKPKVAVSVYHKPEDIIEIPRLLLEYNPEYRFWLRHYSLSWFDTVLYAI